MKRFCGFAKRLSFTSTPFTMKMLSKANEPLIASCPPFGVFSVTAGDSVAIPCSVRGVASASTSSCLMLVPTIGVAIGAGVSATTWTVSDTPAGRKVTLCSTTRPSATFVSRFTVAKPDSSNDAV